MTVRNQTVAVIGAGDFIGSEIAKKFAAEGFTLFVGRRNGDKLAPLLKEIEGTGGTVFGRSLDARKEEEVVSFLSDADKHAPLEVCVFNIGANVNFPLLDTTERVFRKVWEMACYSGFLAGREAARLMLPHGRGSIFFTGATASLRGGVGFAAFASAKVRVARSGAGYCTGVMAEEHPCRASHHQFRSEHGMGEGADQRTRRPSSARQSRSQSADAASVRRRSVLASLSATSQRMGV